MFLSAKSHPRGWIISHLTQLINQTRSLEMRAWECVNHSRGNNQSVSGKWKVRMNGNRGRTQREGGLVEFWAKIQCVNCADKWQMSQKRPNGLTNVKSLAADSPQRRSHDGDFHYTNIETDCFVSTGFILGNTNSVAIFRRIDALLLVFLLTFLQILSMVKVPLWEFLVNKHKSYVLHPVLLTRTQCVSLSSHKCLNLSFSL